jgi:hypothetical protein
MSELALFDGSIDHFSNYIALLIIANSEVKPSMPAGSFLWNRRTSLHVWNRFREGNDIEKQQNSSSILLFFS